MVFCAEGLLSIALRWHSAHLHHWRGRMWARPSEWYSKLLDADPSLRELHEA